MDVVKGCLAPAGGKIIRSVVIAADKILTLCDTFGTREKSHCKRGVTLRDTFGTMEKCKRGVTICDTFGTREESLQAGCHTM